MELCDRIIDEKLDIRWVCNSRVDTVTREMLNSMREAGCWLISFGIESSSQKILDNVKKGITPEQSKKAVKMTHRAGIATIGHFVFGLPGETEDSIKNTIRFARRIPLNFAEFYIATPFPGSELFNEMDGRSYDEINWDELEYSHQNLCKEMNLEKHRKKAYMQFYLRPWLILRDIRLFGLGNLHKLVVGGIRFLTTI